MAVVPLGANDTDAGTETDALLLESATASPAAGAGALAVIVHVLTAPDERDAGAQTKEATVTGGARLMVATLEAPFNAAVMLAD